MKKFHWHELVQWFGFDFLVEATPLPVTNRFLSANATVTLDVINETLRKTTSSVEYALN